MWNSNIVHLIRKLQRRSLELAWKHKRMSEFNDSYEGYIFYSLLALSVSGVVLNAVSLVVEGDDPETNVVISILNVMIAGMIGFISKLQNSKKYGARSEMHMKTSKLHIGISDKIEYQLSLPNEQRQNDQDYYIWVQAEQQHLVMNSETVDPAIHKEFAEIMDKRGIRYEDDFDNIQSTYSDSSDVLQSPRAHKNDIVNQLEKNSRENSTATAGSNTAGSNTAGSNTADSNTAGSRENAEEDEKKSAASGSVVVAENAVAHGYGRNTNFGHSMINGEMEFMMRRLNQA